MRKQLERKWLQDDSVYMGDRKEEMRHNMVHRRLDSATVPADRMFENVQFFNETAVQAKIKSALKEETRRRREETGILKELAPARIDRLKAARQKQIDPSDSSLNAFAVKGMSAMQKSLKDSHDRLRPPKKKEALKCLEGLSLTAKRPTTQQQL